MRPPKPCIRLTFYYRYRHLGGDPAADAAKWVCEDGIHHGFGRTPWEAWKDYCRHSTNGLLITV